jgi:phosphatidylserine decarboxylase
VLEVSRVQEDLYVGGPTLRVSVFLGLLDVHVNRSPAAGTVEWIRHQPGRFLQAFRPEAAQVNEHNLVAISHGSHRVLVRQVAGILARRIVCWVGQGETVEAGQRLGMIKFGSRVEVFVPEPCEALVQPGERVVAGRTPVARRRPARSGG